MIVRKVLTMGGLSSEPLANMQHKSFIQLNEAVFFVCKASVAAQGALKVIDLTMSLSSFEALYLITISAQRTNRRLLVSHCFNIHSICISFIITTALQWLVHKITERHSVVLNCFTRDQYISSCHNVCSLEVIVSKPYFIMQ